MASAGAPGLPPYLSAFNAPNTPTATQIQMQQQAYQLWQARAFAQMYQPSPLLQALKDSATPVKIDNAGIKLGEIIAWRAWKLTDLGFVQSMFKNTLWAPQAVMRHDSEPESRLTDQTGGVHAWPDATGALNYLREYEGAEGPFVIGRVALWGEVIEHERGYRAEFAKPVSFDFMLPEDAGALDALRIRYGLKQEAKA